MKKIKRSKFLATLLAAGMGISGLGGNAFACKVEPLNNQLCNICDTLDRYLKRESCTIIENCFNCIHRNRTGAYDIKEFNPKYIENQLEKHVEKMSNEDLKCGWKKLDLRLKRYIICAYIINAAMNFQFVAITKTALPKSDEPNLPARKTIENHINISLLSILNKLTGTNVEDITSYQNTEKPWLMFDILKRGGGVMPFTDSFMRSINDIKNLEYFLTGTDKDCKIEVTCLTNEEQVVKRTIQCSSFSGSLAVRQGYDFGVLYNYPETGNELDEHEKELYRKMRNVREIIRDFLKSKEKK